MKNTYLTHKIEKNFRLITLTAYFLFLVILNFVAAPVFGLGITTVSAATIDTTRLVQLANESRLSGSLNVLTVDQKLVNAAYEKAVDMFKKQYWSHYGPNGETPWQFITSAGYVYSYAGENLAKDFNDTDSIHTAWMNSSSHKANIMNTNYKNIGISVVSGKQICNGTYPDFNDNTLQNCINTTIVVQMFGTLSSDNTPILLPSGGNSKTVKKNITPQNTPTSKTINAPVITEPRNDDLISTNNIAIKGSAQSGTTVTIADGDKKLGSIIAEGGAFDMRDVYLEDGEHTISAYSQLTENGVTSISPSSFAVTFTLDTVRPIFQINDIVIQLNNSSEREFYVEGKFGNDTIKVVAVSQGVSADLSRIHDNTFGGKVKIPVGSAGLVLFAYDGANNNYSQEIPLPSNAMIGVPAVNSTVSSNLTVQKIISIAFGLIILLAFVIDSYIVWKSGAKGLRVNAVHHIVPIVIVLIVIITYAAGRVV